MSAAWAVIATGTRPADIPTTSAPASNALSPLDLAICMVFPSFVLQTRVTTALRKVPRDTLRSKSALSTFGCVFEQSPTCNPEFLPPSRVCHNFDNVLSLITTRHTANSYTYRPKVAVCPHRLATNMRQIPANLLNIPTN